MLSRAREYRSAYSKKRYHRLKKKGVCVQCQTPTITAECPKCLKKQLALTHKWRAKKRGKLSPDTPKVTHDESRTGALATDTENAATD